MAVPTAKADQSLDALSKLRIQRTESREGPSWFARTLLVLAMLLGIVVAGIVLATKNGWLTVSKDWVTVPDIMQSRMEVRLATVTVETGRSADATVVATGYLESRRQARIGARAPGRIQVVNVEEGSRVETGQILAVLEHADLEASLAAVEASLARAKAALEEQEIIIQQNKRDLERIEPLWKSKIVTDTDYDVAKFRFLGATARSASLAAEIALAAARVREAEQMKANMFIRAPFNGTVISKDAEVGESILPGGMGEASGRGSAVTVADLDHMEVECDVKEDYISRVIPGQTTEVAVDAVPKFRYQGRVRKIIPKGDRARATIKVKVEIINVDDRLFPNMGATVYFLPVETSETAKTPERRTFCDSAAIQSDDTIRFVWIADDQDRVRRQDVKAGLERDNRTEILSGLSGGERVVIATPGIQAGQLVKINR
ncbi:MAG: efflux RND transporter periplasmic adaptor subunit [Planctomycetales bacterium]|nr:efflux RND transporter periplasmic adaptor subunit [Planctomycetales bacterium]